MDDQTSQVTIDRIMVALAGFVIVIAGMRAAEAILVPFLLSVFLAIIGAPPLFWMQRKGVSTIIAVFVVIATIIIVVILIGALVGTSINDFTSSLPIYQTRINAKKTAVIQWLSSKGIHISGRGLVEQIDPGAVMRLVANTLGGLGTVLTNTALILMTTIFILFEASDFPAKMRMSLGDPNASLKNFDEFTQNVKRYVAIKTIVSLITGLIIAVWLKVLGVDYALLWGLMAFLFNFVPNIGSIIAAVPAVLLAFIQLGTAKTVLVAIGYIVVNAVIGNVIEPRFMGRGLGLSTLVVFLSLVFWGWVLGPVGMLLSVPLTMMVKIALDTREDTRWIAILLGSEINHEVE